MVVVPALTENEDTQQQTVSAVIVGLKPPASDEMRQRVD